MVGSWTEKGRKDARRASEEAMAGELDVSIRSEDSYLHTEYLC